MKFLDMLDEDFDAVWASKTAEMCKITYYLEDEAKDVHKAQISDLY